MMQYKKGMIIMHPDKQTNLNPYRGATQQRAVQYSVAGKDVQRDQTLRARRYQRGLIIVSALAKRDNI
jgi:hypothetical protein